MKVIVIILILILFGLFYYKKDNFVQINDVYQTLPDKYSNEIKQDNLLTKMDLEYILKDLIPVSYQGQNVSYKQNEYDLIFKDIIINSQKRNTVKHPNPNKYSINLPFNLVKIYKAELINVNIPAATDKTVNIRPDANRIYFQYINACKTQSVTGYVVIQPGTYLSPSAIATELERQICSVINITGLCISKTVGVSIQYNQNLNRYVFRDRFYNCETGEIPEGTFAIFPRNGDYIMNNTTVTNSMADVLNLLYDKDQFPIAMIVSGPKTFNDKNGVLVIDNAVPGDFGEVNGRFLPVNRDIYFSNCILSDVVLTDCNLLLSINKLNGNTCNVPPDESGKDYNIPDIFCQIPNNTTVSSANVKTLLNQPSVWSTIQFYNPPVSKLNRLDITWYDENGAPLKILDHCFTIRIYYLQRRLATTDFS
jgi:hypothetical protein